jgi:hypothetical protein
MTNRDFSDMFAALNAANVRYLLIGAHAVAFHAEPRYTKDLDIWVEASPESAGRVIDALRSFGSPMAQVTEADFVQPGVTFQIGVPPNRIDICTQIEGIAFSAAWENRIESVYGDQRIWIIAKPDLLTNKRAAGRPQDLLDVDLLAKHTE